MKELIKKHLFGKTKQEIEDKQDELMHFEVSLDNREEYLNNKQDEHAEIVRQDLKRLQQTSNELDKRQKALTKKEEDVFFKEFDLNDKFLKKCKEQEYEFDVMVQAVSKKDAELDVKAEELEKLEKELKAFEAELNKVKEERKGRNREMIVDEFGNFKGFK